MESFNLDLLYSSFLRFLVLSGTFVVEFEIISYTILDVALAKCQRATIQNKYCEIIIITIKLNLNFVEVQVQ